jgi:hypothetical protein
MIVMMIMMVVVVVIMVVIMVVVVMAVIVPMPVRARTTSGQCTNDGAARRRDFPLPSDQRHSSPMILAAAQAAP